MRKINLFSILLTLGSLTISNLSLAQADSASKKNEEYDITSKVEGVTFKKGITKVQEFNDGSYLAIRNEKGKNEFVLFKGGKMYPPTFQPTSTAKESNTSTTWRIGWCNITVNNLSSGGQSSGGPKIILGPLKILATAKCDH